MARRRYLVAYDIRDPVRLRAIHKTMKAYGQPLQYSVFVSDLDGIERVAMIGALQHRMNLLVDSVVVVDLGSPATTGTSSFQFIGARMPLPRVGPTIV